MDIFAKKQRRGIPEKKDERGKKGILWGRIKQLTRNVIKNFGRALSSAKHQEDQIRSA